MSINHRTKNLRHIPCPDCSAKALVYLFKQEKKYPGQVSKILLDRGSPEENVPIFLLEFNFKIIERQKAQDKDGDFVEFSILKF